MRSIVIIQVIGFLMAAVTHFQAQSCKVPFSITFGQVTKSSIHITWSDVNNMPAGWEIEILEKGQIRTFIPSFPLITKKEFTISGLKPSTPYELYIRTVCSENQRSNWNVAIPFTTVLEIPTACQISIPLKDNGTEVLLLDVPDKGILGVDIFLQQVDLIIEHNWAADLKIILESPQGQRINLVSHPGTAGNNFGNILDGNCKETCSFSMQACNDIKSYNPPFTGLFKPEGSLATWRPDTLSKGYWKLIVTDRALKDIGTLKYLNLTFNKENCAVPEDFKATRIDATSVSVAWKGAANCNTVRLTASSGNEGDTLFINCKAGKYTFNNLKPSLPYCFTITSICSFSSQSQASCCLDATTTCAPVTQTEDFESFPVCLEGCGEMCSMNGSIWRNSGADGGQDWIVWSGATDTENTGPSGGQGGSDAYVYLENNPTICSPGKDVYLESACMDIQSGQQGCDLSFFYHMFGTDITQLSVEITTNNAQSWETIQSIQGDQGNVWRLSEISLQDFSGKQGIIRFSAQTSEGPLGDIGLDRISFLGSIPTAELSTYYADGDGDGYGRDTDTVKICMSSPPPGFSLVGGDCDDTDADIHPGMSEIPCNGIDENCNGLLDDLDVTRPIRLNSIIQNVSCNGSSDGYIALSITGGQSPYRIVWNDGQTGDSLSNIPVGIYHATITDALGCIAKTDFFEVKATNNINALVIGKQSPFCSGSADGAITIAHSGGTAPYQYLWSEGSNTQNIEGLMIGTYSVTITDANNCSTSLEGIQLQAEKGVRAGIKQIKHPLCPADMNAVVELYATHGTLPYRYTWSNGGSGAIQEQLGAGQYVCTITDQTGCQDVVKVDIIAPPTITPKVISTEDVRCFGEKNGSIKTETSGGTPPYTFLWNQFALTDDIFNLAAGNYTLTVTDAKGCQAETPVIQIQQPLPLTLEIDSIRPATCLAGKNGVIAVSASGGNGVYNYAWNHDTGSTSSFANLSAGNYSVTAFDKLGCKASIANINLPFENKPIETSITLQNVVACHKDTQGSISLTIRNGQLPFNCNWSHGYIGIIDSTKDTLNNLASGTYRVTVTDSEGCTGISENIELNEPEEIRYMVSHVGLNLCRGDKTASIQLEVNGGIPPYDVTWNSGQYSGINLQNLEDGVYQGEIMDAQGCRKTLPLLYLEPVYDIQTNEVVTNDINSTSQGSVCLFPSGGLAPYRFDWENRPSMENCLKDLIAGAYTVTITDSAGCRNTSTFSVGETTGSEDEVFTKQRYKIYPNPASSEIYITPYIDGTYKIYNHQGFLILDKPSYDDKLPGIFIGDFAPGIYSLIIVKEHKEIRLRFIKL